MDTTNQTSKISYIVGLGNPIIDISATIEDDHLTKYNLGWGKTVFASDENIGFYEDLESQKDVSYIPGGSVTNSIRISSVNKSLVISYLVAVKQTRKIRVYDDRQYRKG